MRGIATQSFRTLFAGLGLALFASAAGAGSAVPFDPTHYWTYHNLNTIVQPQPIFVRDQFFRNGVPVTVDQLERLVNWVHKNNSAVPDTFLHYTWWNVLEKLPVNRQVIVTNQFGSHIVQVLNLEFLLAPATKNNPPVFGGIPTANHYLCYRATGFPAPPAAYDLVDEWRVDTQQPRDMEFLCTPCLKEHNGVVYPPVDTVTHLAAYPIAPQSGNFVPFVNDQFTASQLFVTQIPLEYLFVPSEKVELPTDTKRSTWSKIKSLYR
jgi:hypothetical protein